MAQVKNLSIGVQSGTSKTLFAKWDFQTITNTVYKNSSIQVGSWVTVKSGSRWYNGVGIASFVFNEEWNVIEVRGNRVVIDRNRSGTNSIMSPIHINNLVASGGGGSSTETFAEDTVDHYTVKWEYDSGNGVWFSGGSSDVSEKVATYSMPDNALKVRVTVTPVSKTHKVNDKDTAYWSGSPVTVEHDTMSNPPEKPPSPSVEIDKYDMTATVNNISDPRSDEIQFEVYDLTNPFTSGTVTVVACMASFKCKLNAGGEYRVRARSANIYGTGRVYSDWTDFTANAHTIPSPPAGITTIRGSSSTSIYLEWDTVNSADTYSIEYATKITAFDNTADTKTVSGIKYNHYEVTGLESGNEYFFRVQAVNDKGESSWTDIKSVVIGKDPDAPTTWSSATTVITGDPLNLYWVHNSEDGSSETYAEVEITIGGDTQTYTVKNEGWNDPDNEDKDKTKHYAVDTSSYQEGTKINWRVRTAGITKTYGDWSIMRTVDVYAPPTLELTVTDQNGGLIHVLQSFPFFLKGLAGPKTQMPIGYHVTISADEGYETVDGIGRPLIVNPNDAVYSKYIDTNDPLLIEFNPSNIDLQNNIAYTVTVIASMNSGLTATATTSFEVSWTDMEYGLDAEIAVDSDTFVAYVTPYCRDEDGNPITDVTLSVYRREFDGTYQELSTGIDTTKNTVVTDPHPALDYARYRIIAISKTTGAVSFYDPPGYPVGGVGAILQWDEAWTDFDVTVPEASIVQPLWNGSLLKLPYNVDVSDNTKTDSSLVKYIGRTYPVSYYGTQIDAGSTWNMSVPKSDKDILYALRRLSIWRGDVYVRESSGSGYWANVEVSFNQKHTDPIIPVTLSITRVEGGI